MHRDLCRCMSGIMRRTTMIQMYWDDASDKVVGTEANVEINIRA